MILAIPLLGERIGPWRWLAAAIALIGALCPHPPRRGDGGGRALGPRRGAGHRAGAHLHQAPLGREPPLQILLISNSIGVVIATSR
jgi:hypothetical protein